jgi:hypothetical protein
MKTFFRVNTTNLIDSQIHISNFLRQQGEVSLQITVFISRRFIQEHSAAASQKEVTASGDMVKTNDYGRYDPAPAFSKPRFKLIPN